MDLIIHDLPAKVWENLDRKAKASGRSVEVEAAAILVEATMPETPPPEFDELQRMVWEMYGGELPKNVVEEFLAERKMEAKVEARKLR